MSMMRAAVVQEHKKPLVLKEVPIPSVGYGQILVKIKMSGVCHTDVHVNDGDWGDSQPLNIIPGHEGCGEVVVLGPRVTNVKLGDRVGIPWLHSACGSCFDCCDGWETVCSNVKNTGYTANGGFAQYVVADASYVGKIPPNLSYEQAAPVLCAGVTVLKALKESGVRQNQFVVITGAAGGLGHMACQYAKAMGMIVIAVTRKLTPAKETVLQHCAVDHVIELCNETVFDGVARVTGGKGAHGAVCIAPAASDVSDAVKYLRARGTVVPVCLPGGDFKTDSVLLIVKAIRVIGSIVGGRNDLQEALDFAAAGKVKCSVQVRKFDEVNEVLDDLRAGNISGRVVLEMDPPTSAIRTRTCTDGSMSVETVSAPTSSGPVVNLSV